MRNELTNQPKSPHGAQPKGNEMKRVNGKKIVQYDVEEHTGGRAGIGAGPATGTYASESAAIHAMTMTVTIKPRTRAQPKRGNDERN